MESLAEDLKAFKLERNEMKSTLLDLRIAGLFRMASPLAASHIRAHNLNRYSIRSELL
jgi:hypothetical protein